MNTETQRGEAYHTGYEASNQGESRDNVISHYPLATWEAAEWLDGFAAASSERQKAALLRRGSLHFVSDHD